MKKYEKGNLIIKSDFEIRVLREEGNDIDLFIPLDYRTLNLKLVDLPDYFDERIQFTEIRNVIIRFSTEKDNNYCTIHLLKSIDLHSAAANFIINYKNHLIVLRNREYCCEMCIQEK